MRGFMELGTVTTEVTPAEVIYEEEHKVRELFRGHALVGHGKNAQPKKWKKGSEGFIRTIHSQLG